MLAANRTGERRLLVIVAKYGWREVETHIDELQDYTERMTRHAISQLPNGVYEAEDVLDNDGITDRPVKIKVRIRIRGSHARVDFPVRIHKLGQRERCVCDHRVGRLLRFRTLVGVPIPSTEGGMRPLEIIAPEGTLLNARLQPLYVAGTWRRRNGSSMFSTGVLPPRCLGGYRPPVRARMNNVTFGGMHRSERPAGEAFAYYETIAGGMGARPGTGWYFGSAYPHDEFHEHAGGSHRIRVSRADRKVWVATVVRRRRGSGVVVTASSVRYGFLSPAQVTVLSDRRNYAPYGLEGGDPGTPGRTGFGVRMDRSRNFRPNS